MAKHRSNQHTSSNSSNNNINNNRNINNHNNNNAFQSDNRNQSNQNQYRNLNPRSYQSNIQQNSQNNQNNHLRNHQNNNNQQNQSPKKKKIKTSQPNLSNQNQNQSQNQKNSTSSSAAGAYPNTRARVRTVEDSLDEIIGPLQPIAYTLAEIKDYPIDDGRRSATIEATCASLSYQLLVSKEQVRELNCLPPVSPFPFTPSANRLFAPGAYYLEPPSSPVNFTSDQNMLDQFLEGVQRVLRNKDGAAFLDIFKLEPPLPEKYIKLTDELQRQYPKGNDEFLKQKCQASNFVQSSNADGHSVAQVADVVYTYLTWIRDFRPNDYLGTFQSLHLMLRQYVMALGNPTYGLFLLPTVLSMLQTLGRFAMALDKNPNVVAEQRQIFVEEGNEKVTFVESAANLVREAFIKCLSDRSGSNSGSGRNSKPENKRVGIYLTANLYLKLVFRCRKVRSAETIYNSINIQSPLLSYYPASQQVPYLYYLGRYYFSNNHFYRAQLTLQAAYDRCHLQALQQRRLILIYLIAANLCLGRCPSDSLLSRPESSDLADHFLPLCRLIREGNVPAFRRFLDIETPQSLWFLNYRILLQLRTRCEVVVWRSLVRRVFIHIGYRGDAISTAAAEQAGKQQQKGGAVPFLRLSHVQAAFNVMQRASSGPNSAERVGGYHEEEEINLEFVGMQEAASESGLDLGLDVTSAESQDVISVQEIESIVSSLIHQRFLNGFLTHQPPRFAIPGSKVKGPIVVGFPNIWQTIARRAQEDTEEAVVPGWVKEEADGGPRGTGAASGAGMSGRVVNLSGARPVGSAPFS